MEYAWFDRLCRDEVFFVSRMKDDAVYEVAERREVPERGHILRDQVVRLNGIQADLRRVEVYDPGRDRKLVFLTNHLGFAASTIAAIYKDRWQVELFFKAIKQNLKIKTFVGTSPNALKTQVWAALIVMLLLRFLQLRARFAWSLSNLVALLRMNLFAYRDLWTWLHEPFHLPAAVSDPEQAVLSLA